MDKEDKGQVKALRDDGGDNRWVKVTSLQAIGLMVGFKLQTFASADA